MRGCVNRISKINPFFYFFAFQKKEKIIVCGRHYKLVIFHRNHLRCPSFIRHFGYKKGYRNNGVYHSICIARQDVRLGS